MTAYIRDAVRTPRGKARPDGGLTALKPQELVSSLIEALSARGAEPAGADALVLGCVGQVGAQGGHIALVTKLHAGLPAATSAVTINNFCVSGLSAVGMAADRIAAGRAGSVLAGGVEMLSRVAFMADEAAYYSDPEFPAAARYVPVAMAADRLAEDRGVTRVELDAVALASQLKTAAAEGTGLTASRIAVNGLDQDECARMTTPEKLAKLPPAFAAWAAEYSDALGGRTIDHRHTVSHAPPMADGAGLALVTGDPAGARARIVSFAETNGDPYASLTAGFDAMDKALAQTGLTLADMDAVEFMEAFAVAIALFLRERSVDADRVNIGGGHLAKGHPMGATGAILLSSLLDALDVRHGRYGLVVATGAQGVGAAMVVERLA